MLQRLVPLQANLDLSSFHPNPIEKKPMAACIIPNCKSGTNIWRVDHRKTKESLFLCDNHKSQPQLLTKTNYAEGFETLEKWGDLYRQFLEKRWEGHTGPRILTEKYCITKELPTWISQTTNGCSTCGKTINLWVSREEVYCDNCLQKDNSNQKAFQMGRLFTIEDTWNNPDGQS